jgi:hypothetical protein
MYLTKSTSVVGSLSEILALEIMRTEHKLREPLMGEQDIIVVKRFARTFVQFAFLHILQRQTRLQPTVPLLLKISSNCNRFRTGSSLLELGYF